MLGAVSVASLSFEIVQKVLEMRAVLNKLLEISPVMSAIRTEAVYRVKGSITSNRPGDMTL